MRMHLGVWGLLAVVFAEPACGASPGDGGSGGGTGTPLPALVSSLPADGDGSAPRTAWIALELDAKVDATALAGVVLTCGGAPLEAETTLVGDSLVVVNPAEDLPASTACKVAWVGATGPASVSFTVAETGAPATVMVDRTDKALVAPLPDDSLLVDDATTRTGKRVSIPSPDRPANVQTIVNALGAAASADGWSPIAPFVVAFSDAPDRSTLPANPEDSVDPLATIGLFDVDPASPTRGERVPSVVEMHDEADGAGGTTSHTLLVFPNRPLDATHEYAVVVTRRALVDSSRPLDPTAFESSALGVTEVDGSPEATAARALTGDVIDALAISSPPMHPQDIAAAVRFTTRSSDDFPRDALSIREQTMASTASYTVTSVDGGHGPSVAAVVHGTFRAYNWRDAQSFLTRDANGDPTPQGTVEVPFVLALPMQATRGQVPIILYQHGQPGSAEVEVPAVAAEQGLAAAGFAVIGFTDVANREVIKTAGVGGYTQAVFTSVVTQHRVPDYDVASFADQLALLHTLPALADLDVLPAGAVDGQPELDVTKPLGYLGISEGSIRGTELVAYAPEIHAAALVVGAGDGAATLLHQGADSTYTLVTQFFPDVSRTELYAGMSLYQVAFDPQDQLNHARYWSREPQSLGSSARASLLTFEGIGDTLVPNVATESAAWAFHIPQIEAVRRVVPGLEGVAGPVSANIDASTTGSFVQYVAAGVEGIDASPDCAANDETEGHFCPQTAASAITQRLHFFQTALTGVPTIETANN